MNGWQRIGVVISVIWASAVSCYAVYERLQMPVPIFDVIQQPELRETSLECQKLFLECERNKDTSGDVIRYLFAVNEAKNENEKAALMKQLDAAQTKSMEIEREYVTTLKGLFYAVLLLPIILGWACSYLAIFLHRWIKQGFNQSK